jgi:hypothetical protein
MMEAWLNGPAIAIASMAIPPYAGLHARQLTRGKQPADPTMKSNDAKKEKKKLPTKTAKEKKAAKAEKKAKK